MQNPCGPSGENIPVLLMRGSVLISSKSTYMHKSSTNHPPKRVNSFNLEIITIASQWDTCTCDDMVKCHTEVGLFELKLLLLLWCCSVYRENGAFQNAKSVTRTNGGRNAAFHWKKKKNCLFYCLLLFIFFIFSSLIMYYFTHLQPILLIRLLVFNDLVN